MTKKMLRVIAVLLALTITFGTTTNAWAGPKKPSEGGDKGKDKHYDGRRL